MKSAYSIAVLAGVVLLAMAPAANGQATPTGSVIGDLIGRAKRSLNDFNYRGADSVAQQLLTQDLSRQQRIDVLQILAATTYPDDEGVQKRDSATVVIRELVRLGVNRMFMRDLSWPGLDALYEQVVTEARASGIAPTTTYDSVQDVLALVSEGRQAADIVERVNVDCYTFSFDELESALRRTRAAPTLPDGLRRRCTRLHVESIPGNATLMVGTRDLGVVPVGGRVQWVQPGQGVELAVSSGTSRVSHVVDLPQGKLLHARFFLPTDTVPWPQVRTTQQIADDLRIFNSWTPATPRPAEPKRPNTKNTMARALLWGLIGGGAGYAAAQFLPAAGCVSTETVPAGQVWKVRDERYGAGESVNLGAGMPCIAGFAGGTGGTLFLFSAMRSSSSNRGANARYAEAMRGYPAAVAEWEARERRGFAERHPEVRRVLADEQAKLAAAKSHNTEARARGTAPRAPEITVRDLPPGSGAP